MFIPDEKQAFGAALGELADNFAHEIETDNRQWSIKGFIDVEQNVYTISSDTKIVSKILEIHLFPKLLAFGQGLGFDAVPADHQNYYPDISFVKRSDPEIKFAVDFKTTYRVEGSSDFCNGFTLGSHGKYFRDRASRKNIQFPYQEYSGHFCLGIIYTRQSAGRLDEREVYALNQLPSIPSVARDFSVFVQEKWRIASDKRGSGNTANIGSINKISDIVSGRGMFSELGEKWFDDYWQNYGTVTTTDSMGQSRPVRTLEEFVTHRGGDVAKVVAKARRSA